MVFDDKKIVKIPLASKREIAKDIIDNLNIK